MRLKAFLPQQRVQFHFHDQAIPASTHRLLGCRPARADDRGDDGCAHVIADLHLQQQLHALHHGHLEEAPAQGLGERAPPGGQVRRGRVSLEGRDLTPRSGSSSEAFCVSGS